MLRPFPRAPRAQTPATTGSRCRWRAGAEVVSLLLLLAFLCVPPAPLSGATISYVYDPLGRLLAVIDPASNTAIYSYDAVGNLIGITRQTSATLALFQFTPASGPVGTSVTLYGTGFSATPASNTVKFNGTITPVLTASTTVLTVTVPAGATTGTISVTKGGVTATSAATFTVGTGGAPTLSSFSPAVATSGDTVTITGTNYDTTLINDRVAFAGAIGAVATATTTTLTVPVPASAQTGRLSVSTAQGQATSVQDFFVAPAGVVAADIAYTGRISVNGASVAASIPTANTNGLMVFDGVAGQRINLGFSAVTVTQWYATVYRPDGVALTTPVLCSTVGGSLDVPVLPLTGPYTIFLDPYSTYTGSLTVTASTELTGTITPGGAAVPITIARVGQNARYTFSGTAGQTVSLGMTAVTLTSGAASILNPDGTTLVAPMSFSTSGGVLDSQVLPTTGTYAILIDPASTYTGNVTLTLYNQPDVTGTITMNGATVVSTLTVPGQRARYTFSGSAGQYVSLGFTSVTVPSVTVSLVRPDGAPWAVTTVGTSGGSQDAMALPIAGTYTVVVDPDGFSTGHLTLTLSSDVTGTLTLNAAPVLVTLARAGQNARETFAGTAGQPVTVRITSNTLGTVNLTLYDPAGTGFAAGGSSAASWTLDAGTLSTTGTYTITVNPSTTATGALNLQVTTP